MKKIFAVSLLFMLSQTSFSQVQWSVFAGPQLATVNYTIDGKKQSVTGKFGFHAGAGLKVPFENKLFFAPAAFYSMKGYKVKLDRPSFPPDTLAIDNNTTIHTFELAFLLQYDLGSAANHFFIKAGPNLDFQLFGKEKFNKSDNTSVSQDMVFSFGDYGRVAGGLQLQLGYEMQNGFFILGKYSHGFGSINNADNGPRIRHRVVGLSIGTFLNK